VKAVPDLRCIAEAKVGRSVRHSYKKDRDKSGGSAAGLSQHSENAHTRGPPRCKVGSTSEVSVDVGGGSGGSGRSPPADKQYGGGDENSQDPSDRTEATGNVDSLVAKLGSVGSKVPVDILEAVRLGRLHPSTLAVFSKLHGNLLVRPLLWFSGTRDRVLADPGFAFKLVVELGIGIFTKSAAELGKRKERFSEELDFVTANVLMALFADFMLVYIPAPSISRSVSTTLAPRLPLGLAAVHEWFRKCPSNAFQKVPKLSLSTSFTLAQRGGSVLYNGVRLLGVGFAASFVATLITNSLILIRKEIDKSFVPQNQSAPLLQTSACYASYMALSSNLRYQIVGGVIEERGIEVLLNKWPGLMGACCLAVRTMNTFVGSLLWIDYARFFGLQTSKPKIVEGGSSQP